MRFVMERPEFDVSAVGVTLKCEGNDVAIVRGEAIEFEVIPSIYPLDARCPGFLQCHSSILNFINLPGMSLDTKEPVGSAIFPSEVLLHLPRRIYSSASGHCLIK